MPTFCGNCGTPFTGAGKFCGTCGSPISAPVQNELVATPPGEVSTPAVQSSAEETVQRVDPTTTPLTSEPVLKPDAPPAYIPPPTYTAPSTPSTGGGSGLKIVFIILGILVFFGLLAMGSCAYIAYRAKQRINAVTGQMKSRPYHGKKDPCALATMTEVGNALGKPVTGMQPVGTSACIYHLGDDQQIAIETTWEGGTMTMNLTHGAMKQISGTETFTRVTGLGDEAYVAPMGSALMMRKGDVMVNIDLRSGGLNAEGAKEIAKKIAARL